MALPLLRVEKNPCVCLARYHAVDRQASQIVCKSQAFEAGDEKPAPAGAVPLPILSFYGIISTWNTHMRAIQSI